MGKALTEKVIRRIATSSLGPTIERARTGDGQAFASLYRDYYHEVFRFVLVRVSDRHLAEDIASETFLRAYGAMHRYAPNGADVGAWFITIARNLVIDHFRSSRVRREVLVGDSRTQDTVTAPSAEDQALEVFRHEPLRSALDALPAHHRKAILLQYWAGWPNHRIAQEMNGRTTGAVKAMRRRAFVHLRTSLRAEVVAK
ncbi:RNA polymerase sigma factor [Streptomyces sp. NPDC002889]|uniref:RNA polymerase sigma factor n=1 Tax=Streptomyces sp. NPDC002889 TaxID=3364669 RepID=UPI0036C840FD